MPPGWAVRPPRVAPFARIDAVSIVLDDGWSVGYDIVWV